MEIPRRPAGTNDQGEGGVAKGVCPHSGRYYGERRLHKIADTTMTVVDVLDDRALPFYQQHCAEIEHIHTDNAA